VRVQTSALTARGRVDLRARHLPALVARGTAKMHETYCQMEAPRLGSGPLRTELFAARTTLRVDARQTPRAIDGEARARAKHDEATFSVRQHFVNYRTRQP
jgi:hypothetical protein